MAQSQAEIAALVAQMPDTDEPGKESKFTGPEPQAAQKVFEEILAGGPESIAELIRLVRASTDQDFKDYRAQYVLHGLVVYVGQTEKEALRRALAEALASHVGRGDLSKGVRGSLIRELQWVGGPAEIEAISSQLEDDELCEYAVSAMIAIREGAGEAFRRALPRAKGKGRLAIVQALGVVGDSAAVAALKEAAGDESRDVRIAAVWSLANMGDPGSADLLIRASDTQDVWERIQAAKSCLLLAEKLLAAGQKTDAAKIYSHLHKTRQDQTERHVREAAENGLAAVR